MLLTLTDDILKKISIYLLPVDTISYISINKILFNLSFFNHGIWYLKLKKHNYLLPILQKKKKYWINDYLQEYYNILKISATKMNIFFNNNNNNWDKNFVDLESQFKKVLISNHLYWFEITTNIALDPGRYIAIWNISVLSHSEKTTPFVIEAKTYNGNSELLSKIFYYPNQYIHKGYKKINLEFFIGGNQKQIVTHTIHNRSGGISGKIKIDYLEILHNPNRIF